MPKQRKLLRKSGATPFAVSHSLFGAAGGESGTALAREASLVVGMHPDEATEDIVDAAIAARTPFAVVPCCVFSRLFSNRRLRGGAFVTTHAQLCEYLLAKHPNARVADLPFAGKSRVVYVDRYEASEVPSPSQPAAEPQRQSAGAVCVPCAAEPEDATDANTV